MELYQYLTVESFFQMGKQSKSRENFILPALNLMHLLPENEYMYGLSLLREAIKLYEKENNIPEKESKCSMPFFRENSRVLIGPEVGLFVIPFFESKELKGQSLLIKNQVISLTWDYNKLAEHCLFENIFLLKGKYEEKPVVDTFRKQLEIEYDKVFFDEEYTGFTPDSRFFSMLCNACLEVIRPEKAQEKEWRMVMIKPLAEADYSYQSGQLIPSISIEIPKDCLKEVRLLNREENPLLFGTLAGFMKSEGLEPATYLCGMQD